MNLVIVESPTKAKTISKFLGKDYKIESSFGHIRDLPVKDLGIDIENNFEPKYVIPAKSKKVISGLKALVEKADNIILASDEDREGEAIAWHLVKALGLNGGSKKSKKKETAKNIKRIVFHEITKDAILQALETPRDINQKLVDAQQARRILDRLVGYKLSPFLWKKVAKGLSAGRVQSVAVRLIVEREREIKAFKPQEYWTIEANLAKIEQEEAIISSKLNKISGKTIDKFEITGQEHSQKILTELEGAVYQVAGVEKKSSKKNPPSPFTTSSLQQTANRWLGFSAKQTMRLAQQLYEGIEIKGEGQVGLITYMRTDSMNLSDNFLSDAQNYIKTSIGGQYAPEEPRRFRTRSKGAQEAHEAIRPTSASRNPESLKDSLDNNQYRLYKLIWQRSIACQMKEALVDATTIDIDTADKDGNALPYQFRANGQVLKFKGYLEIYPEKSSEVELPDVSEGEILDLKKLENIQHFTQPPARYSDAGLVKALERHGIGRPSTYAPTIATIEERNYVQRDEAKRLFPTDIAFVVNDLLMEHFQNIVDLNFTANMERNLDRIAQGKIEWQPIIRGFYGPFEENLKAKYSEVDKNDIMPEVQTEEVCDKCGAPMIIKASRYGKFLACSAFPQCKNSKPLDGSPNRSEKDEEKIKELEEKYKDEVCPKCGAAMVVKNGRFGPFLACTKYPKCKGVKNLKENSNGTTGVKCPVCNEGEIVAKRSRRGIFYACNRYPDCKTSFWGKPTGEKCPDCSSLLIEGKDGVVCSNKACEYKK